MSSVYVIEGFDYDIYNYYGTYETEELAEKALELLREDERAYNERNKAYFKKHWPAVHAVVLNAFDHCYVEEHTVYTDVSQVELPHHYDWETYKEKQNEGSDIGAGV